MNEDIETILKDFTVNNKKIPIAFLRYRGNAKTFITYQEIDCSPELEADDMPLYGSSTYDFDIYSIDNYLDIIKELKKKMIESGFLWIEDSEDMYEEDTKFYHKTITFAKERSV